jgi:hypothetical protein
MKKAPIAAHPANRGGVLANNRVHNDFKLSHLHPRWGPEVKRSAFQMLRLPSPANVAIVGFSAIATENPNGAIPARMSDGFKGVAQGR